MKPKSKTPKYMADYKRKYRKQQKKLKKLQKKQDKFFTENLDATQESDHFVYDTEYAETVKNNLSKITKFAYDWLLERRSEVMQKPASEIAPFTYIINAVDKAVSEVTGELKKTPIFWLRELILNTLIKEHMENPDASPFWRLGNAEDHETLLFELDEMTRNNFDVLEGKQK